MPAPKHKTVEELQTAIDAYMQDCQEKERPPTVAGLSRRLGYADTKSVYELAERKDVAFAKCVKAALIRIEEAIEEMVLTARNPAGAIFLAKARFGFRDQVPLLEGGNGVTILISSNVSVAAEIEPLEIEREPLPILPEEIGQ